MSRFKTHPWTQAGQFLNRSNGKQPSRFNAYLASLSEQERLKIKQAEMKYLEKLVDNRTRRGVAERDYAAIMVGVRDVGASKGLTVK